MSELDIRIAAFAWLKEHGAANGGVLPGSLLARGFDHAGERINLKGASGIWVPRGFDAPISISSYIDSPYHDTVSSDDGLLTYAYRGQDANFWQNQRLRNAFRRRTPLIFFNEIYENHFQAIWPIIILEDHPDLLNVKAALEPAYSGLIAGADPSSVELSPLDLRRYVWTETKQRLHQGAFRDVVINAYGCRCTVCRLAHPELLDAAHITPDWDDRGTPVVQNGLSLCKIHHAAFDTDILGISPDYQVHISTKVLGERDGPMLKHGLQELDGAHISLPSHVADHPDRERLARRFERWLRAG